MKRRTLDDRDDRRHLSLAVHRNARPFPSAGSQGSLRRVARRASARAHSVRSVVCSHFAETYFEGTRAGGGTAVEPGAGTGTGFGISPALNRGNIWSAMATA